MNWIKQINNKVEERWINSSYEFKCVGVLCGDYEGVVGMMYSFR